MTEARILIGMLAFHGADVIREALDSIGKQDHSKFRVLISVDGGDAEAAAACEPFLDDPRFSLVVQPRRLGWAGNINWLMSQPDYDFFCFWQHDCFAKTRFKQFASSRSLARPCDKYACGSSIGAATKTGGTSSTDQAGAHTQLTIAG